MRADAFSEFTRFRDVIRANGDKSAISNFHFTLDLQKPFMLSPILWTVTTATQNNDHRIFPLQLRKPPAFRCVIRKFVVWKNSTRNYVGSHMYLLFHEGLNQLCNFIRSGIERKMACIQNVYLCFRYIASIRFES